MFCSECGNELALGSKFCATCGASTNAKPVQQPNVNDRREIRWARYAVALFLIGLVILSLFQLRNYKRLEQEGIDYGYNTPSKFFGNAGGLVKWRTESEAANDDLIITATSFLVVLLPWVASFKVPKLLAVSGFFIWAWAFLPPFVFFQNHSDLLGVFGFLVFVPRMGIGAAIGLVAVRAGTKAKWE